MNVHGWHNLTDLGGSCTISSNAWSSAFIQSKNGLDTGLRFLSMNAFQISFQKTVEQISSNASRFFEIFGHSMTFLVETPENVRFDAAIYDAKRRIYSDSASYSARAGILRH